MCKVHSKVTYIKQQIYFYHQKSRGYNKNSVFCIFCIVFSPPQGSWISMTLEVVKIYLLFYVCHFAVGLTHCYKTTAV